MPDEQEFVTGLEGVPASEDDVAAVLAAEAGAPEADLDTIARSVAAHAGAFVATVGQIASRTAPEATFPVLLLATSDLLASGARLGAMVDVVPPLRYEPDTGPDADLDTLRIGLAEALEGFDEYAEVVDPVLGEEVGRASLSGDLATVTAALQQGLAHYDAGDVLEALWWWQFSYLSSWGERASSALRMLQLVLCHIRLDVEDDVAAEAEYDALQA